MLQYACTSLNLIYWYYAMTNKVLSYNSSAQHTRITKTERYLINVNCLMFQLQTASAIYCSLIQA